MFATLVFNTIIFYITGTVVVCLLIFDILIDPGKQPSAVTGEVCTLAAYKLAKLRMDGASISSLSSPSEDEGRVRSARLYLAKTIAYPNARIYR